MTGPDNNGLAAQPRERGVRGEVLTLLLDTNVLMDYLIRRSPNNADAAALIGLADAEENIVLYTASLTLKDVYYLVEQLLKRDARAQGKLTDEAAAAARNTAWACIRLLLDHVLVVPIGQSEVWSACSLRHLHDDFEDDLILAAALRAEASYIVTGDKRFEHHIPQASVDTPRALELARRAVGRGQ